MSGQHPIPAVVGALYHLVETVFEDDADTRVDLGDPGGFEEPNAVGIGLATTPVDPVEDRETVRSLGYDNHEFDVVCVALAWSGDEDRLAWMAKAFGLIDTVRAALADPANRTLGLDRVLESAPWIARTSFGWAIDDRGRAVKSLVEFSVRCKAYRPRR